MAAAPDPDEVLSSTLGKEHFQRVARLLISGGTALLREVFDQHCPPSNLPTKLKNPATVKQLKAAKLTKPQWDCLYPSPGVYGKSTDFDVTLLFRLLRTICNLIPPATGWDALPATTDHSLEADLARIKYYRNSVYGHVKQQMEITDDFEFLSLWQEISGALVRIAGQISPAKKREWQKAIDNFVKDPLTAEDERNAEELQRWYRNDMEVKETMEKLEVTTHEGFKCLEAQQKNTTEEVQEGVARLETTLKGVEGTTHIVKDMLCQVFNSLAEFSQSTQAGILTNNGTRESSSQVETSEVTGLGMNGHIVYESGVRVTEVTFKYEQVKVLQGEIGEQCLRLWDIIKRFVATNNELVTKCNEYRSRELYSLKRSLVWGAMLSAGVVTAFFTLLVGSLLSGVGGVVLMAEQLKSQFSANEIEKVTEKMQLSNELQQRGGQFKEALHVFETKLASFNQHLGDIVKFCHEHPNELVVLREFGQVSTQQVLSDINSFMSRLEHLTSSARNAREIKEETIEILVEEPMPFNKEVEVIEDDSAFNADEMVMKWKGLITAPIISTTKTMT